MSVILDVTRLLSRLGMGPLTGIDRVERAYLDFALGLPDAIFLMRTTRGYLILGAAGGAELARLADGADLPAHGDRLSRLIGRGDRLRHRAEAALRPFALARALHIAGLGKALAHHGGAGHVYINVGHSRLHQALISALGGRRKLVMVHDLIPLTHPEFARPDQVAKFGEFLAQTCAHADVIVTNSQATRDEIARSGLVTKGPLEPIPLGLWPQSGQGTLPLGISPATPRFVMIGTIEPRKNHALILQVWEMLARDLPQASLPHLHLIGRRGWITADFAASLDRHPLRDVAIFEHNGLDDAATRGVLTGARGLLFPSFAEGFGYPPLEAMRAGVPVIASDLPVLREITKNRAIFLSPLDPEAWKTQIKTLLLSDVPEMARGTADLPDWDRHFGALHGVLTALRAG